MKKVIIGFFMAWGSFLWIPCPVKKWDEESRNWMLVMFPLLGFILGAITYTVYSLLDMANVSYYLLGIILVVLPFWLNGFIHLDGFMDCSDAILSRRDLETRKRILKDSHVGAFAVVTTIMLLLIMYASMITLLSGNAVKDKMILYIILFVISRLGSASAVLKYKPMETSQYKESSLKAKKYYYLIVVIAITVVIAYFLLVNVLNMVDFSNGYMSYGKVLVYVITILLSSKVSIAHGRKQLDGMNGDISGYALTISEAVGLFALAIL